MSEVHYVRFWVGKQVFTLGYREPIGAQRVYEQARDFRLGEKLPPIFEATDDFGNVAMFDMSQCSTMMRTSTASSANLDNAMQVDAMKGKMRLQKLVEQDAQLLAWLKMASGRGSIMPPNGGMQ